ncbi:MAG TPA: hypothetical protein VFR84_12845 [Candidatus Angelobacter sp.]|nr:hypothetical protein [Candidatus Angelobacter sp.]
MLQKRAILLLISCMAALAPSAMAKHRDDDRDSAIARAAYERGYQDGYDRGYSDHGRRAGFDYRCRDYDRADRGYYRELGERARFQDAYRLAFRAGYGEGYRVHPRARVVVEVIFGPGRHDECREDDRWCGPHRGHHKHHHDDDDDDDD